MRRRSLGPRRQSHRVPGARSTSCAPACRGPTATAQELESAWATALALAYLERWAGTRRDAFAMIVVKAERWLAQRPLPADGRSWQDAAALLAA
jgi:hypothetical protein